MEARPETIFGSILADLGGVLFIIGVFLPYVDQDGGFSYSVWDVARRMDWVYLALGLTAMVCSSAAFLTGMREALKLGWAVGLVAVGLTMYPVVDQAFHYGDFGAGFWLLSVGAVLMAAGAGIGLRAPSAA